MSLKSTLNELIKQQGSMTIKEIYAFCDKAQYKYSNAERRLRRSESPNIQPVYNDKRTAIVGYKYSVTPNLPSTALKQTEPSLSTCSPTCAFNIFKIHNLDCLANQPIKEPELKGLF